MSLRRPQLARLVLPTLVALSFVVPETIATTSVFGVSNQQILIGAGLPLTGKLAYKALPVEHAVQAYFQDINEQGGVNGRRLKLVVCDDAYEPDKATDCFFQSLKDGVFAAGFFTGSPNVVRYVKNACMSQSDATPLVGFLAGMPPAYVFHHNIFVCRPSYATELEVLIGGLLKVRPIRKIAIVYQNDALGAACRDGALHVLQKNNLGFCAEGSYSREKRDIEPALASVVACNPDAILLGCSSSELKAVLELRRQRRWHHQLLCLSYADDALVQAGPLADGVLISQVMPALDEPLPAAALYRKLLKKHFPRDVPDMTGYEAFANAVVFVEGLKRAGPDLTREKFVHALESLHSFDAGIGSDYRITFTANSHVGCSSKAVYIAVVRNGTIAKATGADLKGEGTAR